MSIVEYQGYGYFFLTAFLTIGLYAYIYHLYTAKKDATGIDYEDYSNMVLKDDIGETPIKPVSDEKDK